MPEEGGQPLWSQPEADGRGSGRHRDQAAAGWNTTTFLFLSFVRSAVIRPPQQGWEWGVFWANGISCYLVEAFSVCHR